jgi:hypothetical protein
MSLPSAIAGILNTSDAQSAEGGSLSAADDFANRVETLEQMLKLRHDLRSVGSAIGSVEAGSSIAVASFRTEIPCSKFP